MINVNIFYMTPIVSFIVLCIGACLVTITPSNRLFCASYSYKSGSLMIISWSQSDYTVTTGDDKLQVNNSSPQVMNITWLQMAVPWAQANTFSYDLGCFYARSTDFIRRSSLQGVMKRINPDAFTPGTSEVQQLFGNPCVSNKQRSDRK